MSVNYNTVKNGLEIKYNGGILQILAGSADPGVSPGLSANVGSIYLRDTGDSYQKIGSNDTNWTKIGSGESASVSGDITVDDVICNNIMTGNQPRQAFQNGGDAYIHGQIRINGTAGLNALNGPVKGASGEFVGQVSAGSFSAPEASITNVITGTITSGSWLRHTNAYGYIDIGPANADHAHIYSDRPTFYFNKPLMRSGYNVWDSGNITYSKAREGRLDLNDTIQFRWGRFVSSSDSGQNIYFTPTFSSYCAVVIVEAETMSVNYSTKVTGFNKSYFVFDRDNDQSGSVYCRYFAVGY